MKDKQIIVIAGPTGSGKTDLAIKLAKKIGGEIINADSRSIYRGMDIGTGKPTKKEMRNITHHLFDIKDPDEEFSVAEFKILANEKINKIHSRGKTPIIVGGTGLYIDALVYDYDLVKSEKNEARRETMEKKTLEKLYDELKKIDPETATVIDPKNKRRLIRALEIFEQTGKSKVAQDKKKPLPENVTYFAIDIPREKLYKRINERVKKMFDTGLIDETRTLMKKYSINTPIMQTMGYGESIQYLNNEITLEEAISKTSQAHRKLAKRQMTWFKKNKDIVWIKPASGKDLILSRLLKN